MALPSLTVSDITVGEKDTFADFVVRLDQPATSAVTVNYATDYRTAVYGSDYLHLSGTLSFAVGETVKTVRVSLVNDAIRENIEHFVLQLSGVSVNATIARAVGTATIVDNDAPSGTPVVTINDFVVDEAAGEAHFVITLDRPSTSVVSMNYATQNGTALAGSDFVAASGSLVFSPGDTAKTVRVPLLNDTVPESGEAFNLVLSGIANATTLDPIGNATIAENDGPVVSASNISVDDIVIGENQAYADFLVRLDAPNAAVVTVNYNTDYSTAVYGSDYIHHAGKLTFAPGEMVKTVRVALVDDATLEGVESFVLELSGASANARIARNVGHATIVDNDATSGTPVVSINDFVIDEAAKEASFAALAGSDFIAVSGSLNFGPGETAKTVKVTLLNDTVSEAGEAFNLVLSGLTNATTLDAVGNAIIAENDGAVVSKSNISVDDIVVSEGQTYADFLVRLDAPNTGVVTVNYNTDYNTAVYGSDYVHQSGYLTFAPGEMVKTVRVTLVNDATPEAMESFVLALSGASANASIARNVALATIVDNDASSGTPVVSINDFVIDEAAKEASFVITLDRPSTSVVSMNYATQNGTALAGSDFVAVSGSLNFGPGETAKTVKVTLPNDTASEVGEAFNLVLSGLTNATTFDAVGNAIIAENDGGVVSKSNISVDDIVVSEGQTYADFLVRLDAPNTGVVTVNYNTDYNTAVYGSDYVHQSGYLTFAPGEMVKTVRVTLVNDATPEAMESFVLELSGASANASIARNVALATIVDNDATSGTPVVSINDFVIDEAAKEASFVITLDRPSTALAGSDFIAVSGSLNFGPGETAKTVKVTLLNDAVSEVGEAFNLLLSSVVNATSLDTVGTAIIAENDGTTAASSMLSVADIVVGEGQTYADFTVRLDAPNTGVVTVNYNTDYNTAVYGSDYVHQTGSLTFAAGETVKTVRVSLVNDATVESAEGFLFELSGASANAAISRSAAMATVIDNDATSGTPLVSMGDVVVDENDGLAYVAVTLDRPATVGVRVNFTVGAVTASAGSDFTAFSSQTVSFAPGETAKTIAVGLVDDLLAEGTEVLDVAITSVTGATVADGRGRIVVNASDGVIAAVSTVSVGNITAVEGDGYAEFQVRLSAPNAAPMRVNYNTDYSTAVYGSDYVHQTGTLLFAAGETLKTVRVALIDDVVSEGLETFLFELSGASANALIGTLSATATVIDNDSAVPSVPPAIVGSSGPDVLRGSRLADTISGLSGNDLLDGGLGNDTMAGGSGDDQYFVDQTGDVVTELAGEGYDKVYAYVNHALAANVEELILGGTALSGTGNALNNVVTGNAFSNVLDGGTGADAMAGGLGDDTYIVDNLGDTVTELLNAGNDLVQSSVTYTLGDNTERLTLTGAAAINGTGNALNNTITGNAANNILAGGAGVDTLSYANATGAATVNLASLMAQNTGASGIDTVSGFENLTGSAYADTLTGDAGANVISGGTGADRMTGGGGNDAYVVDNAADVVVELAGGGTDSVQSSVTYALAAEVEWLQLTGSGLIGATGNATDNTLTGNAAGNAISGLAGNDRIAGAGGNDTLTGGLGLDRFVFNTPLSAVTNLDTITDFVVGQDTIVLGRAVFSTLLGSNVPLDPTQFFAGAAATAAADASDRIVYNTATGALYFDADGVGGSAATQFAKLSTVPVVNASSFFVEA